MSVQRYELQRKVKEARRSALGCQECGRTLPQGLMLGGQGPTFSELVMEAGMTWEAVETQIKERGFMCRKCLNYTGRVRGVGTSGTPAPRTRDQLLRDPEIRASMRKVAVECGREVYFPPGYTDKDLGLEE